MASGRDYLIDVRDFRIHNCSIGAHLQSKIPYVQNLGGRLLGGRPGGSTTLQNSLFRLLWAAKLPTAEEKRICGGALPPPHPHRASPVIYVSTGCGSVRSASLPPAP